MPEDTQPKPKGKPITIEHTKDKDGVVHVVEYNPTPMPPDPPTDGTNVQAPTVDGEVMERKGRKAKQTEADLQ